MRKLKYSATYADSSNHLKETKSWQELLEREIPDDLLTKVHKGLLHHKNWQARNQGLDKGYKLKKRYDESITIKGKLAGISDEEIEGRIAGIISGVIGSIAGKRKESS